MRNEWNDMTAERSDDETEEDLAEDVQEVITASCATDDTIYVPPPIFRPITPIPAIPEAATDVPELPVDVPAAVLPAADIENPVSPDVPSCSTKRTAPTPDKTPTPTPARKMALRSSTEIGKCCSRKMLNLCH